MKKKGLALLVSSVCALSLAACGSGNDGNKTSGDTWSIFVYMCGSDLESQHGMGTLDLQEMMSVADNPNVNVYVETGGSSVWNSDVPNDKLTRYKVENGSLQQLEVLDNASMGDAETLKSFMDWGKDNYGSDKNMLVMWDHGTGVDGLCVDENYGGDLLSLEELKTVMDSRDYGYEVIGFDCCLMANIETLNIVKNNAKYIVASEETEPGGGWSYDKFISDIAANPGMSGADAGKSICDTYYEQCQEQGVDSMITLSVVDTGKLDNVNNALGDYMGYVNGFVNNAEEYGKFVRSVGKTENYGGISSDEEGFFNLFDIVGIAEKAGNVPSDKKDHLVNAVSDAVVYRINGSGRKGSNGISIFYPYVFSESAENTVNTYGSVADSGNYGVLLENIKNENSANTVADATKLTVEEEPFADEDGYYKMKFSEDSIELLDDVVLNIYIPLEDNTIWIGSDRQADFDENTGYVTDNFNGFLPMLNGEYISYYVYDAGEDYILYNVPVKLNGKETTLKLMWEKSDDDGGKYTILGTRDDTVNEKEITPLKAGDKLVPLYYVYDAEGNNPQTVEGAEITCTGEDKVEDVDVTKKSDYYISFMYKDIYGNSKESGLLHVEY